MIGKRKPSISEELNVSRTKPKPADIVSVLDGEDAIKFTEDRELLRKRSDFFKAAFSGDWKETASVRLPDHDPEQFKAYIAWLHDSGQTDLRSMTEQSLGFSESDRPEPLGRNHKCDNVSPYRSYCQQMYTEFIDLRLLGDYLQAPAFQAAVRIAMFTNKDHVPIMVLEPDFLAEVWERTTPGSHLRRWFFTDIQWSDAFGLMRKYQDTPNALSVEFRKDLLNAMYRFA